MKSTVKNYHIHICPCGIEFACYEKPKKDCIRRLCFRCEKKRSKK